MSLFPLLPSLCLQRNPDRYQKCDTDHDLRVMWENFKHFKNEQVVINLNNRQGRKLQCGLGFISKSS